MKRIALILVLSLVGCKKSSETPGTGVDQVVQLVTTSITGLVQAQELVADFDVPVREKSFFEYLIPLAWAASCNVTGGTSVTACPGSSPYVKTRTYNCSYGTATVSGTTVVTYSNAGCTLGINGTAIREPTLTFRLSSGVIISQSSAAHTDYRGISISGGQKMTKAGTTRTYDVLGMRRAVTSNSNDPIVNLSSRTTSAFTVTGSTLSDTVLTSGTLEVTNNSFQYLSTWSAVNVSWSTTCSCPVSGTMEGIFEGALTGIVSITYTSTCGKATLTYGGADTSVTLDHCTSI